MRIGRIAAQLIEEKFGIKNINTHAREGLVRLARHWRGVGWFLEEGLYDVVFVDVDNSEGGGFRTWHFEATDGDIRARLNMLLQHDLVVHLVNLIPRGAEREKTPP